MMSHIQICICTQRINIFLRANICYPLAIAILSKLINTKIPDDVLETTSAGTIVSSYQCDTIITVNS